MGGLVVTVVLLQAEAQSGLGVGHGLLRGVHVRQGVVPQTGPVGLRSRLDDHPPPADVVRPRKLLRAPVNEQ